MWLVIVGKDPFPSGATDIPFCKATWQEQRSHQCSAKYVLASLGFPLDGQGAKPYGFDTPAQLFAALRDKGIVFLNASYQLIGDINASGATITRPIRKKRDMVALRHAYQINRTYLASATTVIFCGEARKMLWFVDGITAHHVVHPDVRNRMNPKTRARWEAIWTPNALKDHAYQCPAAALKNQAA